MKKFSKRTKRLSLILGLIVIVFGVFSMFNLGSALELNEQFANGNNENAVQNDDNALITELPDVYNNYRATIDDSFNLFMYTPEPCVSISNTVDKSKYQLIQSEIKINQNDMLLPNKQYVEYSCSMSTYTPTGITIYTDSGGYFPNSYHIWDYVVYDYSGSAYGYVEYDWSTTLTYGSVEFWMSSTDTQGLTQYKMMSGATTEGVIMYIQSDYIKYYSGGSYYNAIPINDYDVVHIRYDFDCTSGGYLGLGQYKWRLTINGVTFGTFSFRTNCAYLDRMRMQSYSTSANYYQAIDGFNIIGEQSYESGQNKYPLGYTDYSSTNYGRTYTAIFSTYDNGGVEKGITSMYLRLTNINWFIGINKYLGGSLIFQYTDSFNGLIDFTENDTTLFLNFESYIGYSESLNYQNCIRLTLFNESRSLLYEFNYDFYYNDVFPEVSVGIKNFGCNLADYMITIPTGIFNQSTFSRFRMLYCSTDKLFYDFLNYTTIIDEFDNLIEIIAEKPNTDIWQTAYIWYYTSIELTFDQKENITVGAMNFEFPLMVAEGSTQPFYFKTMRYSANWWDFLLNALIFLLNLGAIILQTVLYLLVVAFNYIIVYVIAGGVVFLFWNLLVRYVIEGGMWLAYWLYQLFFEILPPVIEYLFQVVFPVIIDFFSGAISYVIGLLLWCFTFGQISYETIVAMVADFVNYIADFIYDFILMILEYLPIVFLYMAAYVLIVNLIYLRYYYCKARGFKSRAANLYESFEAYKKVYVIPSRFLARMIRMIKFW